MIRFFTLVCLVGVLLTNPGCTGSKKLSKRAASLEEKGNYKQAAQLYYESLQRNKDNLDARLGLSETGQRCLNDKLSVFSSQQRANQLREAVYSFRDAELYKDRVSYLGLDLSISSQYKLDYQWVLDEYLKKRYAKGNDLLASKRFSEARELFDEIDMLKPNYKNLDQLQQVAQCEPNYQQAKDELEAGEYRKAYNNLETVLGIDSDYKDSRLLRDEALERGRYTVSVKAIEPNGYNDVGQWINGHLMTALTNLDDPFLRIVQPENMNEILAGDKISKKVVADGRTTTELGQVLGAHAILTGRVLKYSTHKSGIHTDRRQAYRQYRKKVYDKEQQKEVYKTYYQKVSYTNHRQSNSAHLAVQYKLISLESGEVLFSKIFEKTDGDKIDYSTYRGEITNLVPLKENSPYIRRSAVEQFQNTFRARRNLHPIEYSRQNLMKDMASSASTDLSSYLQQR